jgi:hypothetical protein
MAVSISLVIACSQQYAHHLDGYMQAVEKLNTQPDEIVLVTDTIKPDFECVRVQAQSKFLFGEWFNLGFDAASSDWVVWPGVDDRLRAHALDQLRVITADVYAFGLQYTTGQIWIPSNITNEAILQVDENKVTCGSPVKRSLWEQTPFQTQLTPFEDWAFWVGCAHNKARFMSSLTLDVDYAYGNDHTIPPSEPTRSLIMQWSKGLS